MAQMPKRVKHRKVQRGHIKGNATRGNTVIFGDYGLQSLDPGWLKAQDYRSRPYRGPTIYSRNWKTIHSGVPTRSITSTPLETRMGKGKGEPEYWVATIKPGTVLYELSGVTEQQAKICFARLAHKCHSACEW